MKFFEGQVMIWKKVFNIKERLFTSTSMKFVCTGSFVPFFSSQHTFIKEKRYTNLLMIEKEVILNLERYDSDTNKNSKIVIRIQEHSTEERKFSRKWTSGMFDFRFIIR